MALVSARTKRRGGVKTKNSMRGLAGERHPAGETDDTKEQAMVRLCAAFLHSSQPRQAGKRGGLVERPWNTARPPKGKRDGRTAWPQAYCVQTERQNAHAGDLKGNSKPKINERGERGHYRLMNEGYP